MSLVWNLLPPARGIRIVENMRSQKTKAGVPVTGGDVSELRLENVLTFSFGSRVMFTVIYFSLNHEVLIRKMFYFLTDENLAGTKNDI